MMARAMPANADFVVEVDAAARAWLDSHKSEGPRVITYDVHRCCGGGKICDVRVRETAHRDDITSYAAAVAISSDRPGARSSEAPRSRPFRRGVGSASLRLSRRPFLDDRRSPSDRLAIGVMLAGESRQRTWTSSHTRRARWRSRPSPDHIRITHSRKQAGA